MSFRDIFVARTDVRFLIEQLATTGCVVFSRNEQGRTCYAVNWDVTPPWLEGYLDALGVYGSSALLEGLLQGYGSHEGFKVVSLNQLDAEALENTALNLHINDYYQPFPTLFVDLPPKFFESHVVPCLWEEKEEKDGKVCKATQETHYPHCVGLRRIRDEMFNYILCSVYYTSSQAFTVLLDDSCGSETLEDAIVTAFDPVRQMKNSKVITPEEDIATTAALRVAMNAVLILEGEGMKLIGPSDLKHYKRLEENLRKAKKRRDPEEKIKRAENTLRVEPLYYTFDQHVVIYDRETESSESTGEPTGRHLSPHWRSGYWRMQRYGVGNSLKKRKRIPPVLVNKHLFRGQLRDTTATYHIRGSQQKSV